MLNDMAVERKHDGNGCQCSEKATSALRAKKKSHENGVEEDRNIRWRGRPVKGPSNESQAVAGRPSAVFGESPASWDLYIASSAGASFR